MTRLIGLIALALFAATIPTANWLISNIGAVCVPNGPCLVPVAPGFMAPSGVLVIGLALVLRDIVQRTLGIGWAFIAIAVGGVLSALFAPGPLVVASVTAFLLSELIDLAVYTPLARRRLAWAVVLSGLAGAVVDSAVFLQIAFGSLDYIPGQVIGKMWAALVAVPVLLALRRAPAPAAAVTA